jgi:hypothetical protein
MFVYSILEVTVSKLDVVTDYPEASMVFLSLLNQT